VHSRGLVTLNPMVYLNINSTRHAQGHYQTNYVLPIVNVREYLVLFRKLNESLFLTCYSDISKTFMMAQKLL